MVGAFDPLDPHVTHIALENSAKTTSDIVDCQLHSYRRSPRAAMCVSLLGT